MGPIESLKNYPRECTTPNIRTKETPEMEQQGTAQVLLTDKNKLTAMRPGPISNINSMSPVTCDGVLSGSGDTASALTNYFQQLRRQDSTKQDQPCLMSCSSQSAVTSSILGAQSSSGGLFQNSQIDGFSSSQSSQGSKYLQQSMAENLLQEMVANGRAKAVQDANGNVTADVLSKVNDNVVDGLTAKARYTGMSGIGLGFGISIVAATAAQANVLGCVVESTENLQAAANRNSSRVCGSSISIRREPDLPGFHMPQAQDFGSRFF
ncbi:unnamed protein product [Ilex paraguariensis]